MGRTPCTFRQRDVTRAVRAAQKAGLDVARVEIDKLGKIVIIARTETSSAAADENGENPWDRLLK
jgi:hypothetical protein